MVFLPIHFLQVNLMNTKQEFLTVPKTARYHPLGQFSQRTKYIWLVLHGYGQLSSHFINKFQLLLNDETLIVAPEGLHRFYLNGTNGRVTKEQREEDIQDYINYLELLLKNITGNSSESNYHLIALGFSQGGATLTRWAAKTVFPISAFVLWASVFPPDCKPELFLRNFRPYFVVGNEDEYLSQEQIHDFLHSNLELGISLKLLNFQGKHTIPEQELKKLSEQIKNDSNQM